MKRFIEVAIRVLITLPAVARAGVGEPERILGVGSRFIFTRDLQFLGGASALYCDGKPAGPFEAVTARHCCDVKVGLPVKMMTEITVKADRSRVVNYLNDLRTQAMFDVSTESTVRCRSQKLSVEELRQGFGDTLRIEELVPPPEPSRDPKLEI